MADRPLPSVFDLTPLNPAFNDDPHALLDRLRHECPVHRDETAGTFVLTRYADVRGVLADASMWRHPARAEPAAMIQRRLADEKIEGVNVPEDEAGASILFLDDPDHARIREPLAKALYKRVAKCRPLVAAVVEEKLNVLESRVEFDAMADFALQVPIDAIARILGVDEHRLMEFRQWSEGAIQSLNPFRTPEQTQELVAAINALSAYFRELMAARRRTPKTTSSATWYGFRPTAHRSATANSPTTCRVC